jgi:release factor glutamine methyltransferase
MTLQEALESGEAALHAGPHPDRARRDAELLLRHVMQHERAALLARWTEKLDEREAAQYAAVIERRATGEPVQYILGETEFYGLPLRVTPDVLIPRPETEHLVEKALELAAHFTRPRIVDVGTGSGAIAIALAHEAPTASVTAVDLSGPALAIARENAERNGVAGRISFLRGDLLAPIADGTRPAVERVDIVVSNPPYIAKTERASLAVEVREFEPAIALFAGDDGLDVYRRLIPAAFVALVPGGFIVLEIGYGQQQAIRELLAASGFLDIEFTPDLQGIARVASAQRA